MSSTVLMFTCRLLYLFIHLNFIYYGHITNRHALYQLALAAPVCSHWTNMLSHQHAPTAPARSHCTSTLPLHQHYFTNNLRLYLFAHTCWFHQFLRYNYFRPIQMFTYTDKQKIMMDKNLCLDRDASGAMIIVMCADTENQQWHFDRKVALSNLCHPVVIYHPIP